MSDMMGWFPITLNFPTFWKVGQLRICMWTPDTHMEHTKKKNFTYLWHRIAISTANLSPGLVQEVDRSLISVTRQEETQLESRACSLLIGYPTFSCSSPVTGTARKKQVKKRRKKKINCELEQWGQAGHCCHTGAERWRDIWHKYFSIVLTGLSSAAYRILAQGREGRGLV